VRQTGTGDAFVISLAAHDLAAALLAGKDSQVAVNVDGEDLGAISLSGSTRVLRGALSACHAF